ncbi:RuvC-like resolvase [Gordonia phage Sapo]|nr:RuvC-like resolvase [Gordonia phage Sapo]
MRWVSVDPGEEYVGFCVWVDDEVEDCFQTTPQESFGHLEFYHPSTLVVEEFRLYPDKAKALSRTTLVTAQHVGALTYWAKLNHCPVYLQSASVKKATAAYCRAHDLPLVPPGKGSHAQDAQVHGYHWLLRHQGTPAHETDLFGAFPYTD